MMRAALALLALAGCAAPVHPMRDNPTAIPPPQMAAEWRLTWVF